MRACMCIFQSIRVCLCVQTCLCTCVCVITVDIWPHARTYMALVCIKHAYVMVHMRT